MRYLMLLIVTISFYGCATTAEPYKPLELTFNKTEPYTVNTEQLDVKLEESIENSLQATPIILTDNSVVFVEDPAEATHVIYTQEQFSKNADIVTLAMAYRDIIYGQQDLVNVHIDTVNSLKELAELERQKVLLYRELWVDSERMYKDEHKIRMRESLVSSVKLWAVTIGSIVGYVALL